VIIFFICGQKITSKFNLNNKFKVVTYETSLVDKHSINLKNMFIKFNYNNYVILGSGEEWNGWYGRAKSYEKYLKTLPNDLYVLLCDCRDVVINDNSSNFLIKALTMRIQNGNKIIVGTESLCCTEHNSPDYKAKTISDSNFVIYYLEQQENNAKSKKIENKLYYINFGMMFGTVGELINLFNLLDIKPGLDDQTLLHKLFYEYPDLLFLDHKHELLSNAEHKHGNIKGPVYNTCYYTYDENKKKFDE